MDRQTDKEYQRSPSPPAGQYLSLVDIITWFIDESDSTTSFLTQLATWDKEEMNEKLQQRVGFSKRAIGKLLQAFDGMLQRYEKLTDLLHGKAVKDKEEQANPTTGMSVFCV